MKIREPINSLTHLTGLVLSILGLILLLISTINNYNPIYLISAIIFSLGLVGLYSASTIYHWAVASFKQLEILRKIDHIMIYFLIAATYTPICLISLNGKLGIILLSIVWSLAILGIILKFLWFNAPRWLYTSFYLILGWIAVFFIYPMTKVLPMGAILLLVAGGIMYTIGAVIYGLKSNKIKIWKFGFHEIFHVFIILGSVFHYIMIYEFVIA